jgi:hypothetical protein
MSTTKPWYQSKTIIGAVVAAFASVAQVAGLDLSTDLQTEIVDAILLAATAVGAILTVVGRVTAKTGISGGTSRTPGPPSGAALVLAIAVALPVIAGGCAYTSAETPSQKVYALQSDYAAIQTAAVGYIESDAAKPKVVAAIRDADATAMDALTAARKAVRAGNSPIIPGLIATAKSAVDHLDELVPPNTAQTAN